MLAGGAIAWGATRGSQPGVIRACVDAGSNTFHLAPPGGGCVTSQTPLEWNVQGPRGLRGPRGAAGSSGDVAALPAANGGGGSPSVRQFTLHVLLAVPGIYSVTGSAELTKFYPNNSGTKPYLLGDCALYEPRPPLSNRRLRGVSILNPSNFTGNFSSPIDLNGVVSAGRGRRGIASVYFSCLAINGRGGSLHNPSLTAIRLGP